jgi:hypothetical protein
MLAGELSALTIEVLPLLLSDATIVLRPGHLAIVRNVAPNQVAPLRARARPSAHKRPVHTCLIAVLACAMTLNCGSTAMMSGNQKELDCSGTLRRISFKCAIRASVLFVHERDLLVRSIANRSLQEVLGLGTGPSLSRSGASLARADAKMA